jgi:hypothetical protein
MLNLILPLATERCLWRSCGWINIHHIDIDNENHTLNFKKFRESLKSKDKIEI